MRSHARNCGTCLPILASRKLRLDTDRSVPSWATQLGVGGGVRKRQTERGGSKGGKEIETDRALGDGVGWGKKWQGRGYEEV